MLDSVRELGIPRLIYASTSGTVGCSRNSNYRAADDAPYCTEITKRWPYYASKIEAEKMVLNEAQRGGVSLICLNPSLVLGPGDTERSSTGDIHDFLEKKLPFVAGGGFNFVDVRDVALAFVKAAKSGVPGIRYLLGAKNVRVAEFMAMLEQVSGVAAPRESIFRIESYFLGSYSSISHSFVTLFSNIFF